MRVGAVTSQPTLASLLTEDKYCLNKYLVLMTHGAHGYLI